MGNTKYLLEKVAAKFEVHLKVGTYNPDDKKLCAYDPLSSTFSRSSPYVSPFEEAVKMQGDNFVSLYTSKNEPSTSQNNRNDENIPLRDTKKSRAQEASAQNKKKANNQSQEYRSPQQENRDPENGQNQSCDCCGFPLPNCGCFKINDHNLISMLMFRNFSTLEIVPFIVSVHHITISPGKNTEISRLLERENKLTSQTKGAGSENTTSGEPRERIINHGVLWSILQMWSSDKNFKETRLVSMYFCRVLQSSIILLGWISIYVWLSISYEIIDIFDGTVDCILEPMQNRTIYANCVFPALGDMFVPFLISGGILLCCFAILSSIIWRNFVSPKTDTIGYNFLTYVFGNALKRSMIWQRYNEFEDPNREKIHAKMQTICDPN